MTTARDVTLAGLLKQYRVAAGLTQEELAERANLSVRAIGDLERGVRRAPHRDTLALLIAALGLSDEQGDSLRLATRRMRRQPDAPVVREEPFGAEPSATLGAIPVALTPLIGREREEAAVAHLLTHGGARLLTLTGPAGIGKTRLAQQVALNLRGSFAQGAVFVPLAPISEHSLALSAIALAVGVREVAGRRILDQLVEHLAERELLLVLDNFEHVAGAAPAIAALLAACPRLTMLITSRTALHLRGEQEFSVPPLDTPDLEQLPAHEDLARYAAIALFTYRAREVRPTFVLTADVAPLVAAICVRLDGLPLAIELAAARVKLLSPRSLLTKLETCLPILTQGAVDLPVRQRTMRGAIEWSYELLSEPERRLFRRLAVFDGGWTLEAAERVCGAPEQSDSSMLDLLATLVDMSLVVPGEGVDGEPRFRLLQLIREYAQERLAATDDEEAECSRRHADYYLAFALRAESHTHGAAQAEWLLRLSQDHANLRQALRWAEAHAAVECILRLATALWWFWQARGFLNEGRAWLERFLSLQTMADDERALTLRADALRGAGNLAWNQGALEAARPLLEESLRLYRQVGDKFGEAHDLSTLGLIEDDQGRYEAATPDHEAALALFRDLHETTFVAMSLNNLAINRMRAGKYAQAIELIEESLALSRAIGSEHMIASALSSLGETLYLVGDLEQATVMLEEGLARFEKLNQIGSIEDVRCSLADLLRERGDMRRAALLFREGIDAARQCDLRWTLLNLLDGAAALAYDLGLSAHAARLFALASKLREDYQLPRLPGLATRRVAKLDQLRASLDDAEFAAEWEAGRAMTLDEAATLVAETERVTIPAG